MDAHGWVNSTNITPLVWRRGENEGRRQLKTVLAETRRGPQSKHSGGLLAARRKTLIRQGESALAFATTNNLPGDTLQLECQILQIALMETTGTTETVAGLCRERRAGKQTKRWGSGSAGEQRALMTFAWKRHSE